MVIPFHDLVLSIHLDPLSGNGLADRFHTVVVALVVFGGYSCLMENLEIIEVIEAYAQLVACTVASALMVVDEVDGCFDLIGEKPNVLLVSLGVLCRDDSHPVARNMLYMVTTWLNRFMLHDESCLIGTTSCMN